MKRSESSRCRELRFHPRILRRSPSRKSCATAAAAIGPDIAEDENCCRYLCAARETNFPDARSVIDDFSRGFREDGSNQIAARLYDSHVRYKKQTFSRSVLPLCCRSGVTTRLNNSSLTDIPFRSIAQKPTVVSFFQNPARIPSSNTWIPFAIDSNPDALTQTAGRSRIRPSTLSVSEKGQRSRYREDSIARIRRDVGDLCPRGRVKTLRPPGYRDRKSVL
jgi:hypothetical protein